MRRALEALSEDDPEGATLVEAQLLGALMICPYLRLDCGTLLRTDFSSWHRGAAFDAIMAVRHPEVGLVVAHLEVSNTAHPPGRTGWGDALSRLLDVAFVEDEAVPDAVRAIKEAARGRRAEARMRRSNAA